jgi:hypothetical protein
MPFSTMPFSTMPFSMSDVSTRFTRLLLNPRRSQSVKSGNRVCGRLLVGSEQWGSTISQPVSPRSGVGRSES